MAVLGVKTLVTEAQLAEELAGKANLAGGAAFIADEGQTVNVSDTAGTYTIGLTDNSSSLWSWATTYINGAKAAYNYLLVNKLTGWMKRRVFYLINANGSAYDEATLNADGTSYRNIGVDVINLETGTSLVLGSDASAAMEAVTKQQLQAFLGTLPTYADNSAALAGGLVAGKPYIRTGGLVAVVV